MIFKSKLALSNYIKFVIRTQAEPLPLILPLFHPNPLMNASLGTHTMIMEVSTMGERTRFSIGDQAPNDGEYMEIGENAFHMGIEDPGHIYLHKGEHFPKNSNDDRKWVLKRRGKK